MTKFLTLTFLPFLLILVHTDVISQTVPDKLAAAYAAFQKDPQLKHAITALYVADAKTGKVLFERNGNLGLVPASTLKVITAATAYELLGRNFRYETRFGYQTNKDGAELLIIPAGDPTFGSWRWPGTSEQTILKNLSQAIQNTGIKAVTGIQIDFSGWNTEAIPDGWLWQDIGNYYGAGAGKLNWRENQFDVTLRSGKTIGSAVAIEKIRPEIYNYELKSEVTAAAPGTGDSAYIYFPLQGTTATIRGTIPVNKNAFTISGAMPAPDAQFANTLFETITGLGITAPGKIWQPSGYSFLPVNYSVFHTITSPSLDSLVYWFNRKSINLYGEALVKTIGFRQSGTGATGKGVAAIRNFWQQKGISEAELYMVDGSGLSPLNRVTTRAQVKVLQHARQQPWFSGFYKSLPEPNSMKMKSGTMHGVKGFCGYYSDKAGNEYVFSFLVNNYSGSSGAITQKMYRVLNVLK